jgi:lanosterol synthase
MEFRDKVAPVAPLADPPSLGLHRGAGEHDVDICSPGLHGLRQLIELQRSDGAWEGEVVWGPVVTAQVVIATALVGLPQARGSDERIGHYLLSLQNDDGGWGLNFRTVSQLFATTLVYVALRLLGLEAGASEATRARRWLRAHPDGVAAIPTWGKMWLAFLGLYPYEGIHPMPVEIALLRGPVTLISRVYCHTRYIYLAMANLRSRRFVAPVALAAALRGELYGEGGVPDPGRCRGRIAATDLFLPPSRWLRAAYAGLRVIEPLLQGALAAVRRAALAHTAELLRDEVESSGGECLSPVNGVLALLALHTTGCASGPAALLADKLDRWAWDDAGGRRFAGARSQTWDTAFALQSLLEFRAAAAASASASAETDRVRWVCALRSGYRYLVERQVRREPASRLSQRQAARGGWCFNDGTHGWPVADCTAEAIIAIAGCHRMEGLIPVHERIGAPWLERAARFILSRQNRDGGFGSYESRRAPAWIEKLAPAEMFGECMTDGSCIECTASCVEALVRLRELTGDSRSAIDSAIARGLRYLRSGQNPDGSFNGTWGINYLYATYFAMRALSAAGASASDPTAGRALQWVRSKQRADGGWGEHAASLREGRYVEHERSLIASTSWAVLAMLSFGEVERAAARGVRWLLAQRDRNGHWLPDGANGAFFGSATLEYRCYNPIFATRAVARYAGCGATP